MRFPLLRRGILRFRSVGEGLLKNSFVRYSLLIFFALSVPFSFAGTPETPVTIYYYDRMPFWGLIDTAEEGFILKLSRLIFEDAGIPHQFEKVPVNRVFEILKMSGPYCIPGAFKTDERMRSYLYSGHPIYQDAPPRIVIRKKDEGRFSEVKTIESLLTGPWVLGRVASYSYGPWVDRSIEKYKPPQLFVTIGDDQSSFIEMLIHSRFDYFFAGGEEASYIAKTYSGSRTALSYKKLQDAPAGNIRWILYSKGFPPDLLKRIDNSIESIKKSQAYGEIVNSLLR